MKHRLLCLFAALVSLCLAACDSRDDFVFVETRYETAALPIEADAPDDTAEPTDRDETERPKSGSETKAQTVLSDPIGSEPEIDTVPLPETDPEPPLHETYPVSNSPPETLAAAPPDNVALPAETSAMLSSPPPITGSETTAGIKTSPPVTSPPDTSPPVTLAPAETAPSVPDSGGITVVSLTGSVKRGGKASLTIRGIPGVGYRIAVRYPSGISTAKGLEPQTADGDGLVTWEWRVGSRTAVGRHGITVSDDAGHTLSLSFAVE